MVDDDIVAMSDEETDSVAEAVLVDVANGVADCETEADDDSEFDSVLVSETTDEMDSVDV